MLHKIAHLQGLRDSLTSKSVRTDSLLAKTMPHHRRQPSPIAFGDGCFCCLPAKSAHPIFAHWRFARFSLPYTRKGSDIHEESHPFLPLLLLCGCSAEKSAEALPSMQAEPETSETSIADTLITSVNIRSESLGNINYLIYIAYV